MATAHVTTTTIDFDGNRYRTIVRLALPTVIAMLSQSLVNEIDGLFFGRLPHPEGTYGQSALLPCLLTVWLFGGSLSALSVGTQALTARRVAEGDREGAGAVLTNAAFFCVVAGMVFMVAGYFLLPTILGFMLKKREVLDVAVAYSRWRLLGIISMAGTMAVKAFFDGIGKTHVHLVAAGIMNVFNVLFCWAFIFGVPALHVPRMGAPGAGLGAFIATWIGLFIVLIYARAVKSEFSLFRRVSLSARLTWNILRLSVPAALATIAMMVGFGLFRKVVEGLDEEDIARGGEGVNGAATTLIVLILKLTFTACLAFGTATATLVGQSLGARRPDDAAAFGWASVRLGLVIFGVIGLCEGVLFTEPILHALTPYAPAVQAAAVVPMRMMGLMTPIIAVAMILSEALFGAGNPKFVAMAQGLLVFCGLLPLSYVLGVALHGGLLGIWLAACIYALAAAIVMTTKFRAGSWKEIRL